MKFIFNTTLLLLFVANNFAAPLIYKSEKKCEVGKYTDLGIFEAVKYKQIRIVVFTGGVSTSSLIVSGGEKDDRGGIFSTDFETTFSTLIEVPPSNVGISVKGEGNCQKWHFINDPIQKNGG